MLEPKGLNKLAKTKTVFVNRKISPVCFHGFLSFRFSDKNHENKHTVENLTVYEDRFR